MSLNPGLVSNVVGQAGGITGELFGKKRGFLVYSVNSNGGNGKLLLTLDASIRENHTVQAPPTLFPIESGSTVTDNFIVKPPEIEVTGWISDNPISLVGEAATTVASALVPPTGIIAGAAALSLFSALAGGSSPSKSAFATLLGLIVNKTQVNVITSLNTWNGMWLKQITFPRDAHRSNVLEFTAHFVQVIVVRPQTVNVLQYNNAGVSAGLANLAKQQSTANANFLNAQYTAGRLAGYNASGS